MNVNGKNPQVFLNSILMNTNHTISSLSEILNISKKRLVNTSQLSERDQVKINELKQMLLKVKCPWVE